MIQIDMPMPTNCLDCPACNEYLMCAIPVDGRKWGENDVREFAQGRPEWCPLKEQEAVVRCKDCVHWIPGRITENDDFIQPRCKRNGGGWSSDDYCSCAERREK